LKEFNTYTEFFKYYIGVLDEKVPQWTAYMTMKSSLGGHKRVHRELPALTKQQVGEVTSKLRELVKFPNKVLLSYHKQSETWFAHWRPDKSRYSIGFPTVAYYWLAYPSILKTALLHELGHIFNGDSNIRNRAGHSTCTNICMDVRCNAPLDRTSLMQINDCLFHFEIKRPQGLYVPEQFYPKVGMQIVPHGWSFEKTHNAYHQKDFEADDERDPEKSAPWIPQVGNFVLITGGKSVGKIAKITGMMPSQECSDFYKLVDEMQGSCSSGQCGLKYDENIDYDVIQRCEYILESVSELEEKIYSKQLKPSEIDDYLIKTGVSAITHTPKKYGVYLRVDFTRADAIQEDQPQPECECMDEKGNPTGEKSPDCCPPKPPPPDPPPPQIGDLVAVKGNKYGKITDIKGEEDKKYTIEEVSVEVVNAALGTTLK